VHACEHGEPGWGANRRIGKGVFKQNTLFGEFIQIGGCGVFIPITTQQGAVVLAGDPQDIWFFFRLRSTENQASGPS